VRGIDISVLSTPGSNHLAHHVLRQADDPAFHEAGHRPGDQAGDIEARVVGPYILGFGLLRLPDYTRSVFRL
jgi:hypothetical protein